MFTLRVLRGTNKSLLNVFGRNFAKAGHTEATQAASHHNVHHHVEKSHSHGEHGSGHHAEHHVEFEPQEYLDRKLSHYKHLFGGPTVTDSKTSAQTIIANNPLTKSKSFLEFMARELQFSKTENETENFRPPKIHENSIFLYQSKAFANTIRSARGADYAITFLVTCLMKQPLFFIPTFGFFYVIFANAFFYEMNRRLVTRMDLLPHLEMIHFQKVTIFGEVHSKLVRISNLEKVNIEELKTNENYFWAQNVQLDPELIFRDKETKELFCFDRDGYWDWKALSHELIY